MTQTLTPQKAAELLKELQYAKVQMGGQLSIRDEYFKQALEMLTKGEVFQECVFGVGDLPFDGLVEKGKSAPIPQSPFARK